MDPGLKISDIYLIGVIIFFSSNSLGNLVQVPILHSSSTSISLLSVNQCFSPFQTAVSAINPAAVTQADVDSTAASVTLLTDANGYLASDAQHVDDLLAEEPDIVEDIAGIETTVQVTQESGEQSPGSQRNSKTMTNIKDECRE